MEIDISHEQYKMVAAIRPLLRPEAARFEIGFVAGEYAGEYNVWLLDARGEGLGGYTENSCRDGSPVDYCRAIAAGNLTVTKYLRGGRRAILRHELRMGGEVLDYNWYGERGGWGHTGSPWRRTLGGARRWDEERTTRYPPYY